MARNDSQNLLAPTGMDATSDPVYMDTGRAVRLTNFLISQPGKLVAQVRFRTVLPLTTGDIVDGVAWYYQALILNGAPPVPIMTDLLVLASGGFLFLSLPSVNPFTTDFSIPATQFGGITGYTPSSPFFPHKRVRFAALQSELIMVQDGGLLPLRFYSTAANGTGFFRAGIQTPAISGAYQNLALVATGTGLTGAYNYRVTFYDERFRESSPSADLAISLTNQGTQLIVSWLQNPFLFGGSNIKGAYVYRDTLGAPGTFYRVANIPYNGTDTTTTAGAGDFLFDPSATYDNTADTLLASGILAPEPGSNDPPNPASIVATFNSRVFLNDVTDPSTLQISNLLSPTQFSVLGNPSIPTEGVRTTVGTDQGDPINALVPFGSVLGVFKRRQLFFLYGTDLTNFSILPVHNVGCISPDTAVRCDNVIFYLSDDGVYAMAYEGGDLTTKVSKEIENILLSYTEAQREAASAVFVDRRYHLMVADTIFVYDFDAKGWTTYQQPDPLTPALPNAGDFGNNPPNPPPIVFPPEPPSVCGVSVSPASFSVPSAGGTIDVAVTASNDALIPYAASDPWLIVLSGPSSGSGTASIVVAENTAGSRSGFVTICDQNVIISQVAASAGCDTTFTFSDPISYPGTLPGENIDIIDNVSAGTDHVWLIAGFASLSTRPTSLGGGCFAGIASGIPSGSATAASGPTPIDVIGYMQVDLTFLGWTDNPGVSQLFAGVFSSRVWHVDVQRDDTLHDFFVNSSIAGVSAHFSIAVGETVTLSVVTDAVNQTVFINGAQVMSYAHGGLSIGTGGLREWGNPSFDGNPPDIGFILSNYAWNYCIATPVTFIEPPLIGSMITTPSPVWTGGTPVTSNNLLTGLVEYWSPIAGVWTGRHAGNNGTFGNGPLVVADGGVPGGFAVVFSHSLRQYASVPDFPAVDALTDFTVSVRSNVTTASSGFPYVPYIMSKVDQADAFQDPFGFFINPSHTFGYVDDNNRRLEISTAVVIGTWQYLTVTYDSATGIAEFFVDGVSQGTQTGYIAGPVDMGTADLFWATFNGGFGPADPNVTFDGNISDSQIWGRILTPTEIGQAVTLDYVGYA